MGYGLNSSKKAIRALCRDPTVGRIKGDTRNSGYGLYDYCSLVLRREWGNELRIGSTWDYIGTTTGIHSPIPS